MTPKSPRAVRTPEREIGVRIPAQRGKEDEIVPGSGSAEDDAPVSVASLLRREGRRVPHAVDAPLQPRVHQIRPEEQPQGWINGVGVRRASAAAGALVAAASVLGAAVLTDPGSGRLTVPNAPGAPGGPGEGQPGSLPGLDLLGPLTPGADVGLAGPVALASFGSPVTPPATFLESGSAFPGAQAMVPAGTAAPGAPTSVPTSGGGLGGVVTDTGGALGDTVAGTTKALGDTTEDLTGTLGDTVGDVGGTLGGAVEDTTGSLGDAVGGPVGDVVGGVGEGLGGAVEGSTDAVDGLLSGVGRAGGQALGDTGNTLGSTVEGVTKSVGGLLSPGEHGKKNGWTKNGKDDDGPARSLGRTAAGLLGDD